MGRTLVLRIVGPAEQVFATLKYYAVNFGSMTLLDIIKLSGGEQFPVVVEKK